MAVPAAIGKTIKVVLWGESPWAICIRLYENGEWDGVIDNHLVSTSVHGLKFNDVVRFKKEKIDEFEIWVPAERAA